MVTIALEHADKKKGTMQLVLGKTTPAFANALRRAIVDYVPTMAIETVEFSKNNSILYDEIVAHRLGLLPITTDLKSYMVPDECKCNGEGCARCQLEMSLEQKEDGLVLAESIKSKDPKCSPVYSSTPIVKLLKNQEIAFVATACLGRGKEHMKWSPGNVWYTYQAKIKVNNASKQFDAFKSNFPPQVFDKKGKIDASLITTPQLIDACEGICDDVVKVEYDSTSFVFYVESWGQLSCKEMVVEGLNILSNQLAEFDKKLSAL
ncbi:DNA-directed RNA polymerase subunit D [Candidatus Woesearchaeota archaeon]|nr:DNA-directed RNA polymerase subunit D [Candidatus Woesearchaeota archaeon]